MLKNVTFTADEELIRRARKSAQQEHTTLNAMFRQWLERYVKQKQPATDYEALMRDLSYARPNQHDSRDAWNGR